VSATFCVRVSDIANEEACLRIEIVACGDLNDEDEAELLPPYPSLNVAAEVDDTHSRRCRIGFGRLGRHRGWVAGAVGAGLLAAIVLLSKPATPGVAALPTPSTAAPLVAVASSAPVAVGAFTSSDCALLTGNGWIGGLYRGLDCPHTGADGRPVDAGGAACSTTPIVP
jgi:hypothetical protein